MMAKRVEQLVIKTNKNPSILNKDMAIGWFAGTIMYSLAGVLPAPLVGALLGGAVGKLRIEKENVAGRVVSNKASFLNKDMLLGGLMGAGISTFLAVQFSIGIAAMATAIAGTTLIGGVLGGWHGKTSEQRDYQLAKFSEEARSHGHTKSPEIQPELGGQHVRRLEEQREQNSLKQIER